MRRVARALLGLTGIALAGILLIWWIGPREPVALIPTFDPDDMGNDLDAYFVAQESRFSDIVPGVEKRVVWAGQTGERTDWSVVYLHGFSATSEEIRPVPDEVAKGLGANLIFTRLRGHGRGSAPMADAAVQDWINDTAEALEAARRIGDRVLIIATSTGATLATAALHHDRMRENVSGIVMVSPNFALNHASAHMMTWPAARYWLPLIAGSTYSFEPINEGSALYWTTEYPVVATLPMSALVKEVRALPHRAADMPVLFWFSTDDAVVDATETQSVARVWGGPVTIVNPDMGFHDDAYAHVIAGDIYSPGQTAGMVAGILDWVSGL